MKAVNLLKILQSMTAYYLHYFVSDFLKENFTENSLKFYIKTAVTIYSLPSPSLPPMLIITTQNKEDSSRQHSSLEKSKSKTHQDFLCSYICKINYFTFNAQS